MEENYNNELETNPIAPKPERSSALSVLCVLSFINAGFQVLSNFVLYSVMPVFKAMMEDPDSEAYEMMETLYGDSLDQIMAAMETAFNVNPIFYILNAVLFIGSFVGVLYMWKLQKKGFHIYTIAQVLVLVVAAFVGTQGMGIVTSAVWTLMWIGAYYYLLKKQGLFGNE